VVTYSQIPINDTVMLFLGFPLGFSLSGIFSDMGVPERALSDGNRGSGQGFCYNFGRAVGSLFPALVATSVRVFRSARAIGILAGSAYLIVVVAALLLPETRGKILAAYS
jgi:hypothetical protein